MPSKGFGTRSMVPFGYGDGGGGPTREMLERARRMADLDGSPKVVGRASVEVFCRRRGRVPRRARLVRGALPGAAQRDFHEPGGDKAGQPPVRELDA